MKRKITVIGHFSNSLDGQTIKTAVIFEELVSKYGVKNVDRINTAGGLFAFFILFFKLPFKLINSEHIIFLPAHRALKILLFLFFLFRPFKKAKLHYCVIGGWLSSFIDKRKWLSKRLKRIDNIYVETNTMKRLLLKKGFNNVFVMPNCKKLDILNKNQIDHFYRSSPLKICTFSRVNKNKGIEEAVGTIIKINKEMNSVVYELDIYGQVEESERAWFNNLIMSSPAFISYKGLVEFNKTVDVLKDYFFLLFPTKYFTEGIPGSIIDAYASGLPIVASKWLNYDDIIDEGTTGISFPFNDFDTMAQLLLKISENPEMINSMRDNCLEKAVLFTPTVVINCFNI